MIKTKLSGILKERSMNKSELSRKTGIGPNAISEICNNMNERINIAYLDKICEYLECDISDILEYVPNKIKTTGDFLIKEEHGNQKNKL